MFKYKNKGYTLAELLVTMVIFSIVMLGICTIMSNTLKSYTVSDKDVELQEKSQIVGNVLEEYLCEATSLNHVAGSSTYQFTSKDKNNMQVIYNDGDNTLSFVTTDGSDSHVYKVADDIHDFNIEGFGVGDDNNVVINFTMGTDYEYKFSRSVALKNDPENSQKNNISNAVSNLGLTPDPSGDDIKINVKRFDEINLTSAHGITEVTSCDSNFTVYNLPDDDLGKDCVMIRPGILINKSFGTSFEGTLVGKDSAGATKTIKLKVDPVQAIDGVIQFTYDNPTNSGLHNVVCVKGINMYNALKGYDGYKCTEACTLSIYNGATKVSSSDKTFELSQYKNSFGVDDIPQDLGGVSKQGLNFDLGELICFCLADPYTGNFIISGDGNNPVSAKCSSLKDKNNYHIKCKILFILKDSSDAMVGLPMEIETDQVIDVLGSGL